MSTRTIPFAGLGACTFLLTSDSASMLTLLRLGICGATLAALSATDLAEHRIPNRLVLPAALVCAALSIADGASTTDLLAGAAVVVLLGLVSFTWPAALGMGDVKLALLVLAGLDGTAWRALAIGIVLAALAGLVVIAREGPDGRRRSLPLAPFITAGALLAVLA
jgi:leader peptidase (prepilin peptidase) / N-methyltransferase